MLYLVCVENSKNKVNNRAKVSKYGDKVLETIETTLKEYYSYDINNHSCSSDADSNDSAKTKRGAV